MFGYLADGIEFSIGSDGECRCRVGRRRYVADGYRYEYYITVKCDGVLKELNVSSKIYGRTRAGYPVELEMKDGLLGFPVVVKVNAVSSML